MSLFSRMYLGLERHILVNLVDRCFLASSIKKFYQIAAGHIYFQALAAAIELDLFTILRAEGPMTQEEIGERIGLAPQPSRILIQVLTATRVLKRSGNRYRNSLMSHIAFCSQNPQSLKATIMWQKHIVYKPMAHFLESLKAYDNVGIREIAGQGKTLYARISEHPHLEKIFQDSMQEISVQANDLLGRYLDFSGKHLVVDVGGGNGTNLLAVARSNPHIKGRVFDITTVCQSARANFSSHGLADRLDAIEGNCFTDPFPDGADVFLFCHFMCIWSKEENLGFLRKAFDKLPKGGQAVVFDIMANDSDDGPLAAAMGSPYFICLATGTGMIYSTSEYEDLCREAGFLRVKRIALPKQHTAIVATK